MAKSNWSRDELLLALDLYLREPAARSSSHPEVIKLSELLNSLPIHREGRESNFRNPNGVAMKLGNFARLDPAYLGAGLTRGNRLEPVVWRDFAGDPKRLTRVCAAIRAYAVNPPPQRDIPGEESEAVEGALLTQVHRSRERNQALVRKKKSAVIAATGALACEACGFDFSSKYGSLGSEFAEAHHVTPLSELAPGTRTRLSDLSILCANCHRMIHRHQPWLSVDELRDIVIRQSPPNKTPHPIPGAGERLGG